MDKHIKKLLFSIPFYLVLRPLIKRNYKLRQQGRLPDKWYWADKVALRNGFFVNRSFMENINNG